MDDGKVSEQKLVGAGIVVDPEAINAYLAEQILASALGERVKKSVDEALKQFGGGSYGRDPMQAAVDDEVAAAVRTLVRTEHAEAIAQKVREALTPGYISGLVSTFLSNLESAAHR